MTYDTIIIGGGITGLAHLHRLRSAGRNALLLEGSKQVGGVIRTRQAGKGHPVELGPHTLRGASTELEALIDDLDLRSTVVATDPSASRRFVLRGGRPVAVPSNPLELVETDLLSAKGKFRMMREPFIGRAGDAESVAAFVERRCGREVLDYLVDPFVSGIYAGDPSELSLAAVFEKLAEIERVDRSILLGGLKRLRRARKGGGEGASTLPRIFSFLDGLSTLPYAIARRWSDAVKVDSRVRSVDSAPSGWVIEGDQTYRSENLIIATDARNASSLIGSVDPSAASALRSVHHAPVAVVPLVYEAATFADVPSGFGILIPSKEEREILGIIYASSIFPHRTPAGLVQLTVMIGGVRRPDLVDQPDEKLVEIAAGEVASILGASAAPRRSSVVRWQPGIPQYGLEHAGLVAQIEQAEGRLPGLLFVGSYRGGVAVADRVVLPVERE